MVKYTIHNSKMKFYVSHKKIYKENYQFNNLYAFLYFLPSSWVRFSFSGEEIFGRIWSSVWADNGPPWGPSEAGEACDPHWPDRRKCPCGDPKSWGVWGNQEPEARGTRPESHNNQSSNKAKNIPDFIDNIFSKSEKANSIWKKKGKESQNIWEGEGYKNILLIFCIELLHN